MNPEQQPNAVDERRSASWDIKNAAGNYASLLLTQFGSAFFSFAAVWLISRKLGTEGYGGVVAIIAASQVAQILVNWTSYAVIRFGTEEFVETAKIARAFWVRTIVMIPNMLLVIAFAGMWFPPLARWLKLPPEAFWLVIAHFAASALWTHVQFSLQAAKLPRVQGFLMMIERLLIFAGLFGLYYTDLLSPLNAIVCYFTGPVTAMAVGLFRIRDYIFSKFELDAEFLRRIVKYSLPLLPWAVVGYLSGNYLDAIFVSQFLSTHDLGVYSFATQINGMFLQIPTVANSLLLPLFITLQKSDDGSRQRNYFENLLPSITFVGSLACTASAFLAVFAIPLVFSQGFEAAAIPLWILLSASVVSIPVLIGYSAISNSTSTTHISLVAAIAAGTVNIVGDLLLIPRWGMAGCAWATFAAFFVSVATFALLLNRQVGIQIGWVFVAMIPSVAGAGVYFLSANQYLALAVCLLFGGLVGYWNRRSLAIAFVLIKSMREVRV